MATLADAGEEVGLAGEPLRDHDIVVTFKLEEPSVALAVVPVREDALKMALPVVFFLRLEQHIPILHV